MENLSNIYGPVSRSSLIMTIQRESKQLQALERENKELRTALEDHQTAVELIMSKYRMQISQLIQLHQKDVFERTKEEEISSSKGNTVYEANLIQAHSKKVMEMASVMRKAIEIDENNDCQLKIILSQLRTENQGLREMLLIANKSGSVLSSSEDQKTVQRRAVKVRTEEKEVQTEVGIITDDKFGGCVKIDEASEVTE